MKVRLLKQIRKQLILQYDCNKNKYVILKKKDNGMYEYDTYEQFVQGILEQIFGTDSYGNCRSRLYRRNREKYRYNKQRTKSKLDGVYTFNSR